METAKFFWILIVGLSISGIVLYWFYVLGRRFHGSRLKFIEMDHDEIFCDDDDCDDD